jgi:hypothetical protein
LSLCVRSQVACRKYARDNGQRIVCGRVPEQLARSARDTNILACARSRPTRCLAVCGGGWPLDQGVLHPASFGTAPIAPTTKSLGPVGFDVLYQLRKSSIPGRTNPTTLKKVREGFRVASAAGPALRFDGNIEGSFSIVGSGASLEVKPCAPCQKTSSGGLGKGSDRAP